MSKNLGIISILPSLKIHNYFDSAEFLHIDKIHNNKIHSYSILVYVKSYLSFKNSFGVDHLCVCESVYVCAVSINRFKA